MCISNPPYFSYATCTTRYFVPQLKRHAWWLYKNYLPQNPLSLGYLFKGHNTSTVQQHVLDVVIPSLLLFQYLLMSWPRWCSRNILSHKRMWHIIEPLDVTDAVAHGSGADTLCASSSTKWLYKSSSMASSYLWWTIRGANMERSLGILNWRNLSRRITRLSRCGYIKRNP